MLGLLALVFAVVTINKAPGIHENPTAQGSVQQIMLKPANRPELNPADVDYWQSLQINERYQVIPRRRMSGGAWVATLQGPSSADSTRRLFTNWQRRDLVEYAGIDAWVSTTTLPDDPLYDLQWQLGSTETSLAALNLPGAWDLTIGSSDVVVAIIDTGVRFDNQEITGRLLPGYDFVSGINDFRSRQRVPDTLNYIKSHDGDGRDSDASDPGDGVDASLSHTMQEEDLTCPQQESTWHGTAMASLVAANGNDGYGMTGVDWSARILPVRAIGKCGGRRSDLLDAIRWSAGVSDPVLPHNPTPARIINLSLGIDDACTGADQQAIDDAVANGAIIVAAVGNLGRDLDQAPSSPTHCNNVLGVTAVDSYGYRASYSSFGLDADVAAPGGEGPEGDNRPILIATNDGYLDPVPGDSHRYTTGTSVASPLVAGVISLMLSVNPQLSNAEIRALLKDSSRAFPNAKNHNVESTNAPCTKQTCGSGLVDANAAVMAAITFDPDNPGDLARAITENQPIFKSGGGASADWWVVIGLLMMWKARRRDASRALNKAAARKNLH